MPASDTERKEPEDASLSADAVAGLVCVYEWSIEGRRRIVGAGGQPVRSERIAHVPIYLVQGELRFARARAAAAFSSLARTGLVKVSSPTERGRGGAWLLPDGRVLDAGWVVLERQTPAPPSPGSLVSPRLLEQMFPSPEVPFVRVERVPAVEGRDGDQRCVELTSAGIDLAHRESRSRARSDAKTVPSVDPAAPVVVAGEAGNLARQDPPLPADDLTDREWECMEALRRLRALTREARVTAAAIAEKVGDGLKPTALKSPLASLKGRGLVGSVEGRRGGTWLTEAGAALARRARETKR